MILAYLSRIVEAHDTYQALRAVVGDQDTAQTLALAVELGKSGVRVEDLPALIRASQIPGGLDVTMEDVIATARGRVSAEDRIATARWAATLSALRRVAEAMEADRVLGITSTLRTTLRQLEAEADAELRA